MLASLLLAALLAAPLGSAWLFLPARRWRRNAGLWPSVRRLVLAVLGTAALAATVAIALVLLGRSRGAVTAGAVAVVTASLLWLPATRRWNARAHLCWSTSVFLFVTYLAYILDWTFVSNLGLASTAGAVVLWLLEVFAAVLACAYLWEICDALGTEHWRRRITPRARTPEHTGPLPFVSLHVPAHNEPPDMVIDTLRSLLRIDYPRYEIVLIDDNTEQESLWRPVQRWCERHGVRFHHLENWPGYKAGALNYALRHLTSPDADLIGVVDSDYQIEPGFLRRCAPAFAGPAIGFVQAPQDYRDWRFARYYRRLYYSYKYFFAVSQPARNERDGAIFAGTMGIIRRSALEQLGGWDEWCITEDAEVSLRLLRAGWSGLHVDQSWGYGIMPLTFEALKGQRYRWCFGGIQILRMHWRSMLPGGGDRNRLTAAQRWAYLAGAIQWYGDLLGLAFLAFLLAGTANEAAGGGALFRKLTIFLVATVPVLVGLGLVRAVALLRRGTGAGWRDALGAFMIWQSTSLVVARASIMGLFARKAVFLRTPKTSEQAKWWHALRANWAEATLALLGLTGIAAALTKPTQLSDPLLAVLLVMPTAGLAAAPLNSWAARRAALPATLSARRRSEYLRDRRSFAAGAAAGGLIGVLAVVIAAAALLLGPGHLRVPLPHPAGPAPATGQGSSRAPDPRARQAWSRTASPRPRPSSPGPSPSASSPSPSPSPSPSTSSPSPSPSPSPSASASRPAPSPSASPGTATRPPG